MYIYICVYTIYRCSSRVIDEETMGESTLDLERESLVTEQDRKEEEFWAEEIERRKREINKLHRQHVKRRFVPV